MKIEDIAISFVPNLTPRATVHLLEQFGSAERVYSASEEELVRVAELKQSIARDIVARAGFAQAERELKICEKNGIRVVASTDSDYPNQLRYIGDYPHIIYMVGESSLLRRSAMCAVVGSQSGITPYGEKMALAILDHIAEVAPETVIVGALEGDFNMVVLSAAVGAGLRVIGVSAAPLSKISTERYLSVADNILTSGGLLLSERGENAAAVDQSLYPHHRLIAGIWRGVVVVESGEIEPVARYADGYGRTLLALPGRVTDSMSWGTNRMIATSMAQMVCTPRDVVELLELE